MTLSRDSIERDAQVMQLYEQLMEVEQRLIPTGLHTFGRAAELKEKADLLRMVASYDRPEHGAHALPRLVADALGIADYDELVQETSTSEIKELIDGVVLEAVQRFCEEGTEAAANWLRAEDRRRAGKIAADVFSAGSVFPNNSIPTARSSRWCVRCAANT